MGKACRFKLLINKETKSLKDRFKSKGLICFNIKTTFRLKKRKIKGYYIWISLTVSG